MSLNYRGGGSFSSKMWGIAGKGITSNIQVAIIQWSQKNAVACRIAVLRVKVQTWRTQYRFPTRFFPKLGFEVLVTETEELDWLLNEINIVWACVAACLYVCLWAGMRSSIRTRSEKPRIIYIQNHLLLFGSFRAGWIFWPLKGIGKNCITGKCQI